MDTQILNQPENNVQSPINKNNSKNWIFLIVIFIFLSGFTYYVLFIQQGKKKLPRAIATQVSNWQVYTNTQYGFSFHYPPDWKEENTKNIVSITNGGINNTITIQEIKNSQKMSPQEVIQAVVYKDDTINPNTKMSLAKLKIETFHMGIKSPYFISNIITNTNEMVGPYVFIPSEGILISSAHPFLDDNKLFKLILSTFVFTKPQKPFVQ